MSLILDAIKKSERERQQQEVPGLGANHDEYHQPQNRKNWLPLIVLFVFIGLILLFLGEIKGLLGIEKQNPVSSDGIKVKVEPNIDSNDFKNKPENLLEKPLEKITEVKKEKQLLTTQSEPKTIKFLKPVDNSVQSIVNLNDEIRARLPAINFSSHVFTGNSATSFVVLNDALLGVGENLNDDIEIVQINKEGIVILFQQQQVFVKALEKINL